MDNGQAMVVCAFGWGKEFRLYQEYLSISGKHYRLRELTQVHSSFRTVLGVPSACLRLHFGREKLILRGIAAIESACSVAQYLTSWCQKVDAPALPVVAVPVSLVPGEQAHFLVNATLCGERAQESLHYSSLTSAVYSDYPAQDHGLLILTNKRIMYIGRKSQVVLEYAHLLQVSRLRGAVAFEVDHWQKRVIFTLSHPEKCAAYVEAILHILNSSERNVMDRSVGAQLERLTVDAVMS